MHVDHVGQKTSINNMISKSKFLNKDILQFNLHISTKFELKCPKTSIYSHFKLAKAKIDFESWNFELTMFKLTVYFNIEELGIR